VSNCRDAETDQRAGQLEVEREVVLQLLNYKVLVVIKTRATTKKSLLRMMSACHFHGLLLRIKKR